jgi:hypothetical protein
MNGVKDASFASGAPDRGHVRVSSILSLWLEPASTWAAKTKLVVSSETR